MFRKDHYEQNNERESSTNRQIPKRQNADSNSEGAGPILICSQTVKPG